MKKITTTLNLVLLIVLVLLLWSASGKGPRIWAQGDGPPQVQAVVSPLLQYQGRLTVPSTGLPVTDGQWPMVFTIYDAATGGATLWSETKNITTTGGLFYTLLGDTSSLSQSFFNGQALWLGIKVYADPETTPRQQLIPVAYALGLVPGAVISTSSTAPALQINNSGAGVALQIGGNLTVGGTLSGGSHTHSGAAITSGTVGEPYIASSIARTSQITPTVWANDGTGSGLDADTVDGIHASAAATANKLLALNGSAKLPASITGDADTVDGIHASTAAAANALLALNASGKLPASITGDAATVGGLGPANVAGAIPINNGVVNANLNADMVDGYHVGASLGRVYLRVTSGPVLSCRNGDYVLKWDWNYSQLTLVNYSADYLDYWYRDKTGYYQGALLPGSPTETDAVLWYGAANDDGGEFHFGQADGEGGWCSLWLQFANSTLVGHYIKY